MYKMRPRGFCVLFPYLSRSYLFGALACYLLILAYPLSRAWFSPKAIFFPLRRFFFSQKCGVKRPALPRGRGGGVSPHTAWPPHQARPTKREPLQTLGHFKVVKGWERQVCVGGAFGDGVNVKVAKIFGLGHGEVAQT